MPLKYNDLHHPSPIIMDPANNTRMSLSRSDQCFVFVGTTSPQFSVNKFQAVIAFGPSTFHLGHPSSLMLGAIWSCGYPKNLHSRELRSYRKSPDFDQNIIFDWFHLQAMASTEFRAVTQGSRDDFRGNVFLSTLVRI